MIMAGGTGGHVFPALAVAEELRRRGCAVTWLGTRRGIEAELVPAHQFPITYIEVAGVRGKGPVRKVTAVIQLICALVQALAAVRRLRPQVVVGFGGFVSGPGGVAARLFRIPLVIHEQNAVAGTTNRLLARIATRVLLAFPGALPRGEHCGNPVRAEIAAVPVQKLPEPEVEHRLRLLILGGSLGAQAINTQAPLTLALLPPAQRPEIWHQAGRQHIDAARAAYVEAGVVARVEPFIDAMATAYDWADLVLCRAGALTVSELAAAGRGAILVPFPHAIDDHQTRNGEWLVGAGAALLIQQRELTPPGLAALLAELTADPARVRTLAANARALAMPAATATVATICLEVSA